MLCTPRVPSAGAVCALRQHRCAEVARARSEFNIGLADGTSSGNGCVAGHSRVQTAQSFAEKPHLKLGIVGASIGTVPCAEALLAVAVLSFQLNTRAQRDTG